MILISLIRPHLQRRAQPFLQAAALPLCLILSLLLTGCGESRPPAEPPAKKDVTPTNSAAENQPHRASPPASLDKNIPPEATLKLSPEGEKRALAIASYAEGIRANQHGDINTALERFREAVINDPNLTELGLKLCETFTRRGKTAEAAELLDQIISTNPTNITALAALAIIRSVRSETEAARKAASRALALSPSNHQANAVLFDLDNTQFGSSNALELMRLRSGPKLSQSGEFWRRTGEAAAALIVDKEREDRAESARLPLPLFLEAVRTGSNSTSILNQTAQILIVNDRYPEAAALLERSEKINPNQRDIRPVQALVYAQIGRTQDALQVAGNDLNLLNRIGSALLSDRKFPAAIQVLKTALKLQPQSPELIEKLIIAHYNNGDISGAIRYLEESERTAPKNAEIQTKLGQLYSQLRNDKAALKHFARAHDLGESPLLLSRMAVLASNYTVADKILESAIKTKKDYPSELSIERARIQALQTNFLQANQILAEARIRFPDNALLPLEQSRLAHQAKDLQAVTNYLAQSLALADANPRSRLQDEIYFQWGVVSESQGQIDAAEQFFKRSLSINPGNHQAMNYLSYSWAQRNMRLEEALELVETALRLDPENPAYIDTLGWVYFRLARYDEALEQIKQAIAYGAEDAEVYDHLGDIYLKLGRHQEALDAYDHALQLDPSYTSAKTKAEEIRRTHTPSP